VRLTKQSFLFFFKKRSFKRSWRKGFMGFMAADQHPAQAPSASPASIAGLWQHTNSQRRLMKGVRDSNTGEDVVGSSAYDDETEGADDCMYGLVQAHEKLNAIDYIHVKEYQNKRMQIAAAMDSPYVDVLVVAVVLVDVLVFLSFELRASGLKDCFSRAAPAQEIVNIVCLSCYILELLIRGFANGWRNTYTFDKKNFQTIFDTAIIAGFLYPQTCVALMHGMFAPSLSVSFSRRCVQVH
jgi:hypothetical protein